MNIKRLKVPSNRATEYLKSDKELSQYWEQLNRDCYGEIIIDSDTLDHVGHVFVWHTKRDKGFIFNLEVKPQYRRQGIGWILLDDAVKKYNGIDLLVDEDNIPAIKLYEKYGFETIKTVNGQLWMKLNQIKQEGVIMFFDRLGNAVTGEPIVEGAHSESSDMVINFLSNIFYGTLNDIVDVKTTTRDVNAIKLALEKTDLTDDEKAVLRNRFLKTPAEPRFSIGERLTDKKGAYAENWVRSVESKAIRKLRHPSRNAEFRNIIEDIRMRPSKPVRPGFEKPETVQEGWFSPKPHKETHRPTTIEDVETMHDIVIDKDFKKFITENPNGCKFKYPDNKIVSKEILEFIDDEGNPSICSLNQFIDANCEYDGCIEISDYCLYIGGWIDDKALYLATNKSSCAPEGSIIFADIIENGYDYTDRIFAKSFKDFLKNANIEKSIKEYSEMDLDEMSDYITEANEESKKARKNAQEFMRNEYGTSHPTSMTSKQRNRMKKWLKDNDYDPKTKTIKTDIIDKKTGKPFRVNLGTNITSNESPIPMPFAITPERAHQSVQAAKQCGDEDDKMLAKAFQKLTHDGRSYINMPKSYMKRHPSISNGVSKHEEGHVADLQYKRQMAGEKLANAATVYGFTQGLAGDMHSNPSEYKADIYSATHNKYKDKIRFLNAITSNDINSRRLLKKTIEAAIRELEKEYENPEDPYDIIESKDKIVKLANDSIDSAAGLVETFEEMIANGDHSDDTRRELSKYKKEILEEKAFLKKIENLSFKESKEALKQRYIADLLSDYKKMIAISNEVSDTEIKLRKLVLKKYINEFAVEYDMSATDVIQEMYQTAFEDYVFQEDFEDEEPFDYDVFIEAKIDAKDRKELDDSCFGLVYTDENGKKVRKYPLTDKDGKLDENHIRQAVRFFNHCPEEHQHQLALNILHAAHKLRLDTTKWDTVNKAAEEKDDK